MKVFGVQFPPSPCYFIPLMSRNSQRPVLKPSVCILPSVWIFMFKQKNNRGKTWQSSVCPAVSMTECLFCRHRLGFFSTAGNVAVGWIIVSGIHGRDWDGCAGCDAWLSELLWRANLWKQAAVLDSVGQHDRKNILQLNFIYFWRWIHLDSHLINSVCEGQRNTVAGHIMWLTVNN
jgi:hypothetical protein